jgi:hypothetical protein
MTAAAGLRLNLSPQPGRRTEAKVPGLVVVHVRRGGWCPRTARARVCELSAEYERMRTTASQRITMHGVWHVPLGLGRLPPGVAKAARRPVTVPPYRLTASVRSQRRFSCGPLLSCQFHLPFDASQHHGLQHRQGPGGGRVPGHRLLHSFGEVVATGASGRPPGRRRGRPIVCRPRRRRRGHGTRFRCRDAPSAR